MKATKPLHRHSMLPILTTRNSIAVFTLISLLPLVIGQRTQTQTPTVTVTETAIPPSSTSCINLSNHQPIANALDCVEFTYASQNKCNWGNWSDMADKCQLLDTDGLQQILIPQVQQGRCTSKTFQQDIRLPVYQKFNICHDEQNSAFHPPSITPSVSPSPTSSPSSSPTVLKECSIEEMELAEVFEDYRTVLLGLFVAAVVTAPALSVYLRNTTERPKKTYLYSCIVKYISAFFSVSILAGGIFHIYISDCMQVRGSIGIIPFTAALVTEIIEFIFDVGRLLIFFGDPGTIDFYQNARWNSKVHQEGAGTVQNTLRCCAVGLSSVPIGILMFVMWNFNLIAQLLNLFVGESGEDEEEYYGGRGIMVTSDFARGNFWVVVFFLYITLSFSCVGGYYLLRMMTPCCCTLPNKGEDQGIGYYWARFKLIAVDVPGLLSSIVINPSSLAFFWTAEFVNDTFPMVAEFIVEKYFEMQDYDDDNDQDGDKDEKGDEDNNDVKGMNEKEKFIEEYNLQGGDGSAYKSISLPIFISRRNGRQITHEILNEFPSQIKGHLDETTWEGFCDEINAELETIVPIKQRKPDRCIRIFCVGVGIIMTFIYWSIVFSTLEESRSTDDNVFDNSNSETQASSHPLTFAILIIFCLILGFLCIKLCFVRDLESESEILIKLEQVCEEYSKESEIYFHLNTKNNVWIWMQQGGLSWVKGVDSIQNIECNYYNGSGKKKKIIEEA